MKTEEAVAHGIKTTAGTVTSAAMVMVGAFSIFATLPILDMKEMGIGLATAVLIDATLVRALLLPATMKLLGDWNWYLPNWLAWLPRLDHRASSVHPSPCRVTTRQQDDQGASRMDRAANSGPVPFPSSVWPATSINPLNY